MSVYDDKINLPFCGRELTVYVSWSISENMEGKKCHFCNGEDAIFRVIEVDEIVPENGDLNEEERAEVVKLIQSILQHNIPYCDEKCSELFELARERALEQYGATFA